MLLGDLMALGSAVTFGLYSVAGRSQRERYGLFTYAGTVYGLGGIVDPSAGSYSGVHARRLPGSPHYWRSLERA